MDENRARRVADALRDRGIDAHLGIAGSTSTGYASCSAAGARRSGATRAPRPWRPRCCSTATSSASSPEIPGSAAFDEAQIVDAIARADYDEPEGRELPEAPPPAPPLMREGGLFRRFLGGFRYDSESGTGR